LAAVAIAGIGYHLFQQKSLYRWVLLGAACLWLLCSLLVCIKAILTNKPWQSARCKATLPVSKGVLWIDISSPLDRPILPGQYVQLWAPWAGFHAITQLAFFYVVVDEQDDTHHTHIIRPVARDRNPA
jgi:hypothetical protein